VSEYQNKCNNYNELSAEVSQISISHLPFMLTISDVSRANDRLQICPGITITQYLSFMISNSPILYEIHAVIYIVSSNHFIVRFVYNSFVYRYDGMLFDGIPSQEGPRVVNSLLENSINHIGSSMCYLVMYFYRKSLIQSSSIIEI